MGKSKAEMGRVREEKRRRKNIKKRKSPKKEDPGARKGRKVAKRCFSNGLWPGGSKSRLAKAAGAEPCGQMRDEKLHAVVARSTYKHMSKSKCTKHISFWTLLEVEMSQKVHVLKSNSTRHHMCAPLLDVEASFCVAGARDCAPCQKWAEREGFVAFPKTMAGVGHLKRICKDAFSVAGAVQETCIRAVRRSVRWFPERDCISEHQVCRFAKMILRDRCCTSWQAQNFRQVEWKNRKPHWYEAISSALNFPCLKEVSQNCFVFDVVNFDKWGSLAELFRFWCCQVQKLRKSRRIAAFSSLQVDRQTNR